MKLSVVISAYNEEANIKDCLMSLKELDCEIVVIDNSSEDKTADVAREFTDKVFEQKNDPSKIDIQKNFGFSKATGEWILSLDADERLTRELKEEIRLKTEERDSSVAGYWIPRKNIIFGKWITNEMWWPDYQLRLFQRGKGKFTEKNVHKSLEVNGKTEKLKNPILHINYVTISQYIKKLDSYTDNESRAMVEDGYKFNWMDSIRFPLNDFVKIFFLQKGYKDGIHGLMLSLLQAFYMVVVFAKVWEKTGFAEVKDDNFLMSVKHEMKKASSTIKYWVLTSMINSSRNPVKRTILKGIRKLRVNNP